MNVASILMITALMLGATPAFADSEANDTGCASAIDFRIVGSWVSEDGAEYRQFLPSSKSLTASGQPVTTESCMATPDDLEEVASIEIAPHLRTFTESHYHLGFIGLDRVLVTFPNGVMRLFRRIVAAPGHVIDAVAHRHHP